LYIMQRSGFENKKGLVFVLNINGDGWNGTWVNTQWANTRFKGVAWRGKDDTNIPHNPKSDNNGAAEFWAPPRGYAVYIPQ
jgi:alpha-amylase